MNIKNWAAGLLATFALAVAASNADAEIIIDFETPDVATTTGVGDVFNTDGFTFTSLTEADMGIIESNSPLYNNSQSLFIGDQSGVLQITTADNTPFYLTTIDLDSAFSHVVDFHILGTYTNGEQIFQAWQSDAAEGFETIALDQTTASPITAANVGFNNLANVQINTVGSEFFTTDNVAVTPIPEPISLALLALGAPLLLRRKRLAS